MSVSKFGCRFFLSSLHAHWSLCTCIKGIISFFGLLKQHCLLPFPSSSSSLSCLLPSLSHVSMGAACVLSISFGFECRGMKGRGSHTDGCVGFLWWCTVGEQGRAASWHERGGGDDELDVNKLSLPTQHSAHCRNKNNPLTSLVL